MNVMGWLQTLNPLANSVFGGLEGAAIGRLLLTLVLCGLIGLERATHDRAAGSRPHILVGVGACVMTLAGAYGFADLPSAGRDPLRVASYVVSGIGFLGAGAILRQGSSVRGLTTAASLWIAAGIGIAVGAGLGGLATVTVAVVLFTLGPLQQLESRLRLGDSTNHLTLHLSNDRQAVGKTLAALDRLEIPVRRATVVPGEGTSGVLRVELARGLNPEAIALLVRRLLTLKYIKHVETLSIPTDPEDLSSPVTDALLDRSVGVAGDTNLDDLAPPDDVDDESRSPGAG